MKISCVIILLSCLFCATAKIFYPATYNNLGCWVDRHSRAIPIQEGKSKILDGNYRHRDNAIQKCARVAFYGDSDVFSVQYGGQCFTSKTARLTYRKYGATNRCSSNGKGGTWANQVYELASVGKVRTTCLGCWRDTGARAIPTLERLDKILDGHYRRRKNALEKCVAAAFARGYKVIALQDGGWCAGSRDARTTYPKYGQTTTCKKDGEGGPGGNQVYALTYEWVRYYAP